MKKTYKYRADKENGFATFQTKPASSIKTIDLNRQIPPFMVFNANWVCRDDPAFKNACLQNLAAKHFIDP